MKKLSCLLLAVLLLLGCVGCAALDDEADDAPGAAAELPSEPGLSMHVNQDTGTLSISRPPLSDQGNTGDAGVWTLFVYLCGTDLETDDGGATEDLLEMMAGADGGSLRFVVQTGGTEEWWNDTVDSGQLQRFLIENGEMSLVDRQPADGMGKAGTLSAFLSWGVERYASAHMGLVFWNHGGGSITGVCFDETDDFDSLSLRELDAALLEACGAMDRKFDFIGFDACLMGSLETANILASYARCMIASEEMEPGTGWDYTAIGEYLSAHPEAEAEDLGRVICDSFLASCRAADDGDICTLSVIDLKRLDELLVAFNDFAREMFEASADTDICADMIRGIQKADNFGGNNKSEGYTNMVDLGGIVSACASYAGGADAVLDRLESAVLYSVSGQTHSAASGLSLYYPLSVQGSQELSIFGDICPSPYYLSFVDRQSRGSVNPDAARDYDEDEWFDDEGDWFWGLLDSWLGGEQSDAYWDYLDGYEQSGDSPLITFAAAPQLDEDGSFWFKLDGDGLSYAADVCGMVCQLSPDGEEIIELGETYDLDGDWETGVFADAFDGWWISLPDGQNLATYIVEAGEDYAVYTSPVLLNGEETNLRLRLDYARETLSIEGAWDGVSEYGALSREIVKLRPGDVITPMYYAYELDGDDEYCYCGDEYAFTGAPELYYDVMADGDYLFSFCIDDIYGDYYISEFAMFCVEDGEVWYYED